MKLLAIATLVATTTIAFAQNNLQPAANTVTNTVSTAAQATVATAKKAVKKTVKKTTAIKNNANMKMNELKGSTTITTSVETSQVAQTPVVTATKAIETKATATTAIAMPAAGTVVATAQTVAPSEKIWSANASVNASAFTKATDDASVLTTIGGDIKAMNNFKVFASQTFETLTLSDKVSDKNQNFKAAFYDAGISTKTGTILGSNDSTLNLRYRNPSGDAFISKAGDWSNIHGFIQAESSIPYNLTSAIGVSVDSHIRHSFMKTTSNKNRVGVIPNFTYSFNDMFTVYQKAGYILNLKDNNEMRREYERAALATGVSINAFSGFNIDMNVNQDKAIYAAPSTGVEVSDFNAYNAPVPVAGRFDEVKYEATMSYNF